MKHIWKVIGIILSVWTFGVQATDFPDTNQTKEPKTFLSAQTFPATINDLDFVERMEVLRDGYEPWESEYDDRGRCVSNCTYSGITIQDDLDAVKRNTDYAHDVLDQYHSSQIDEYQVANMQKIQTKEVRCIPYNSNIRADQKLPLGRPLLGLSSVTSGYGQRVHPVTKKQQVHKGIDFSAPVGTDIFVTANGVVENVWTDKTCGKGLLIKHSDGFSSLYCHLSDYTVKPGDKVGAGCVVGKTGNTGRSTGPHLHYGLYYNSNIINPDEYISR